MSLSLNRRSTFKVGAATDVVLRRALRQRTDHSNPAFAYPCLSSRPLIRSRIYDGDLSLHESPNGQGKSLVKLGGLTFTDDRPRDITVLKRE